jgi:hypothetical protein
MRFLRGVAKAVVMTAALGVCLVVWSVVGLAGKGDDPRDEYEG